MERIEELRAQLVLLHSLANDTTENNWRDKRLYVLQTCVRMSDALSALEAEGGTGWRSMDSAPKDGKRIIIAKGNDYVGTARWVDRFSHTYGDMSAGWYSEQHDRRIVPDRWMPLPTPPALEGGKYMVDWKKILGPSAREHGPVVKAALREIRGRRSQDDSATITTLHAENESLRAETISAWNRRASPETAEAEAATLRARIAELEGKVERGKEVAKPFADAAADWDPPPDHEDPQHYQARHEDTERLGSYWGCMNDDEREPNALTFGHLRAARRYVEEGK